MPFLLKSGKGIVYLTASRGPAEWVAFVDRLQAKLIDLDEGRLSFLSGVKEDRP
jgi:hypothetical protein